MTLQPLPECPKSRDVEHGSRAAREIPARQIRPRKRRRTFGRGFRGSIAQLFLRKRIGLAGALAAASWRGLARPGAQPAWDCGSNQVARLFCRTFSAFQIAPELTEISCYIDVPSRGGWEKSRARKPSARLASEVLSLAFAARPRSLPGLSPAAVAWWARSALGTA